MTWTNAVLVPAPTFTTQPFTRSPGATPSISPARANARTYCSPASFDAAYGERGSGSAVSVFGNTGVSPYTELELEYTIRATRASTHASSRRTVALTFA